MTALEAYRDFAPRGTLDLLLKLAERLRDRRFLHVNAGRFGGGAAELLNRLVPMLREVGIDARWEVVIGTPEFYAAVGALERGLAGTEATALDGGLAAYAEGVATNAATMRIGAAGLSASAAASVRRSCPAARISMAPVSALPRAPSVNATS